MRFKAVLIGIGLVSQKHALVRGIVFKNNSCDAAISPLKNNSQILCTSVGIIFAITEITPSPPMARVGRISLSFPE